MKPEMQAVVDQVANSYARRCWWAELDDLKQEAWGAVLSAHKSWQPTRGPLRPYIYRAAALALRRWTLNNSSPVSAPWRDVDGLRGLLRAPVEEVAGVPLDALVGEAAVDSGRLTRHMNYLIGADAEVVPVVLGEASPLAVSRRTGLKQADLRARASALSDRLRRELRGSRRWR